MEVKIVLNEPHDKQQEFLDSKARFKVLLAGRRFGKSLISQHLSILNMLNGKCVGYITPVYALGKFFYEEVLKLIPDVLIQSKNKSDLEIKLVTGGELTFFTGEKLDNLRGRKFHLIVIDEAAYIPDLESAWLNSIRPTLTDYKGEAVFISTPRGMNYFYSLYTKGLNGDGEYASFKYTTYDNPYIDISEIDAARDELPSLIFAQEYLAEPSANLNNPFGTDNIERNTVVELSSKPAVCYGIDLAKTSDWTVITGLDGDGNMCHFDRFQLPWELTIERVKALPRHVRKLVDSTGVGDVVVEQLQSSITNVEGFKFTASSKPQLIMSLIKNVETNKLGFTEVTAKEMSVFEYKVTSTGHIKYEAQSGFHDDAVISLALANWIWKQTLLVNNWTLYDA